MRNKIKRALEQSVRFCSGGHRRHRVRQSALAAGSIALLLVASVPLNAAANPAGSGQITVHVMGNRGRAVSGALIRLHHAGHATTFRSTREGATRHVEPGVYSVTAHKVGFGTGHAHAMVTAGSPSNFTVALVRHVGYSGGFHRVFRRYEVVAEIERHRKAHEHDKPEEKAEHGKGKEKPETLDTTPNGALKKIPGTQQRRNNASPPIHSGFVTAGGGKPTHAAAAKPVHAGK